MTDLQGIGIVASAFGTFLIFIFIYVWIERGISEAFKMIGFILGTFSAIAVVITIWFWVWGAL